MEQLKNKEANDDIYLCAKPSYTRLKRKNETCVPLLMFSQRNNPYCELLQISAAKI